MMTSGYSTVKRQEVFQNKTIKMIHHFVYLTATELPSNWVTKFEVKVMEVERKEEILWYKERWREIDIQLVARIT